MSARSYGSALLAITRAVGEDGFLPQAPIDLALAPGDFALVEVPSPLHGSSFANLCMGLTLLSNGNVRFLNRDWNVVPEVYAQAMRGHIGRLFHQHLRSDTPDVAERILLGRLHHTRHSESLLREQVADIARLFGLPGLPCGPARLFSEHDLLRAAAIRAFFGEPRLLILELPASSQDGDFLAVLLRAGAIARCRGAAVVWLVCRGPALSMRDAMPTLQLQLADNGLITLGGGIKREGAAPHR